MCNDAYTVYDLIILAAKRSYARKYEFEEEGDHKSTVVTYTYAVCACMCVVMLALNPSM